MSPARVLLMHITKSSGHHRAAVAIENALRRVDPAVETLNINGFAYAYPILEKIVNRAYMNLIRKRPHVWDNLYDNPKVFRRGDIIKKILSHAKQPKLARLFRKFQPDAVVCSQAFPCSMVGDFKKRYRYPVKLIGVLTDFVPHHFWLHPQVDYYIVPNDEAKHRFVADGIPAERIRVLGIPIDPKFLRPVDQRKVFHDLDLVPEVPTFLVMGGGQGLGPTKAIVSALTSLEEKFQLIVLAGTNKKTHNALKDIPFPHRQRMRVLSYVENVHELMDIASLVITKPGGMTTAEALAKGLPMVIVDPIPGQETRNTQMLLKQGIAVKVNDPQEVGSEVQALLRAPEKLQEMSRLAIANSRPRSAIDIAQLVLLP